MERYVCIHGHFYQPPRENPWLEDVELQDSSYPFHDWNLRITDECYRQNAASRILGPDRKIIDIVNNYASISFNFGPTLLGWLKVHASDVYAKILEADKYGGSLFCGHGPAIAQAYNHMILPLANERDKHTQVVWGIRDFRHHFGRQPEGMWLPETAVNTDTLEVLACHGIKFTILSPRQAGRIRKIGARRWSKVTEKGLDTTMAYICNLPSGKSINLFFYDGAAAHNVAFGGLLHSGEDFAKALTEAFRDDGRPAGLVHIATDGESFGHHHRHGDMALAYCLHRIRQDGQAKVTVYGQYLEKFPPSHEAQIVENSSWSCSHGIERWKSNCGCCGDQSLSGRQQWREPLRSSLDRLRDRLAGCYEKRLSQYCRDPWRVRNEYIEIINDRSGGNLDGFIGGVSERELPHDDKVIVLKLLEMQRAAMLMYTSCGWFFDNVSGIETVQIMQYAARAMQLYEQLGCGAAAAEFKAGIEQAPAGAAGLASGRQVYETYVEPAQIDLYRVAAHFALGAVFADSEVRQQAVYCYTAQMKDYGNSRAGSQSLATGRVLIRSNIVLEEQKVDFATYHIGGHNLLTALAAPLPDADFRQLRDDLETAFYKGDTNGVVRQMNQRFGGKTYSLWHLFKDEQRRLLHELLGETWEEIERSFRHIYEQNYAIMLMMRQMNMNLPKALAAPAEFIVNKNLCEVIRAGELDIDRLSELTGEAARLSLQLDQATLRYEASTKINSLMAGLEQSSRDIRLLSTIESALKILGGIVEDMDLQPAQNIFFKIGREQYRRMKEMAPQDSEAANWVHLFGLVAGHLGVVVE